MKTIKRRSFLSASAVTLAATSISSPSTALADMREAFDELVGDDDKTKKLIEIAVGSARSAGASYADARLTLNQKFGLGTTRNTSLGFGVRVLVDGYWGFASSPIWNTVEAARLGRDAVGYAKANVLGRPREMLMAPKTVPESGSWIMPVKDDPFEMDPAEMSDFCEGLQRYFKYKPFTDNLYFGYEFNRQQKIFGSSDGQLTSQRLYRIQPAISIRIVIKDKGLEGDKLQQLSIAGLGFEYLRDQPLRQYVDELYEQLIERIRLPRIPVDVGKYPVLVDSTGLGECIKPAIGFASEVDRAMGFEANGGGTSYITEPDTMLGTLQMGSPAWNISASRSIPGACSTVRWDDEGVKPKDFDIVSNGILVGMQTDRESYSWLKPYYERKQMPHVSTGCAHAPDAIYAPLVRCADLTVAPNPSSGQTIDDLRSQIDEGIEWYRSHASFDYQMATGMMRAGNGIAFKIKNGKRVAKITNAGMLFRTSELMKNLVQLGDASTVLGVGGRDSKGQPSQDSYSTIYAPAALFKDMTIIDVTRKA